MQYSIVNFKEVFNAENDFRIDADYYHPLNIELNQQIVKKPYITLQNDDIRITDGEHGSPCWDKKSKIKYITAENIKPNYIEENDFKTISEEQNNRNKRSQLRVDDVLIYSVGFFAGYAAVAEPHLFPANIPRSVAILRLKTKQILLPEYLCVFINSKFGAFQSKSLRAGNAQPMLALEKLGKIKIVCLDKDFQIIVKNLYHKAYELRLLSKSIYQSAQDILLNELNLAEWQPKHQLSYIKNYSQAHAANRLDAEYFHPQYDDILNAIKNYPNGFSLLQDIITVQKGLEVGSEEYCDEGIPFIRVSNLTPVEINNNNQQYISNDLYNTLQKSYQPRQGEILLSKDATPGIAYFLSETPEKMIPSGGIIRLKIKDSDFLPEYLTLVLNSILVQKQIERTSSGALIRHWLIDDINATFIPKLKKDKQQNIVVNLQQSFVYRTQSKQLLTIAQKGVELAIEQNEQAATTWINQQLHQLGVII